MKSILWWVVLVAICPIALFAQGQRGVDFSDELVPIVENVFVFEGALWLPGEKDPVRTNSLVVIDPSSESVLVADGQDTAEEGKLLIQAIRKVTPFPIRYLINASPHGDHVHTNDLFSDSTIVGHHRATAEIAKQASAEFVPVVPDITFEKHMTLQLGQTRVELYYFGAAHTPADTLVYLPEKKLLFLSEVYFNHVFPSVFEGFAVSHLEVIRQAKSLDVDWLIPGHGIVSGQSQEQLAVGLDRYRDQVAGILAAVEAHVDGGGSLRSLLDSADENLKPYVGVPFYGFLKERSLRGTYEALTTTP